VVGFTGQQTETTATKILLTSKVVKGKIAFGNSLGFQAQIDDLGLKMLHPNEKSQKQHFRKNFLFFQGIFGLLLNLTLSPTSLHFEITLEVNDYG